MKHFGAFFVILSGLMVTSACVGTGGFVVRTAPPPPPPYALRRGPAPGTGYVWTDGFWAWRGGRYVWEPGQWMRPPHPRAHWVPGRWAHRRHGYVWIEGRWR